MRRVLRAVLAWTFAGAVVGLAVDLARARGGRPDVDIATTLAVAGGVLGTTAGFALLPRARAGRPLPSLLTVAPYGLAFPALLWIGAIVTVSTRSTTPALVFAAAAAAAMLGGWRTAARGALESALATGDLDGLARLGTTPLVPPRVREHARWARGTAALAAGDPRAALRWIEPLERGARAGDVAPACALAHLALGDVEEAQRVLARAFRDGDRHARTQADAVRVALVLRRDGPAAARALGEGLATSERPALLLGALAQARWRTGDEAGARALLTPSLRAALRTQGLDRLIPEVGQVLAALSP